MKKQKLDPHKEKIGKLKLRAGAVCLGMFLLMIIIMLLTSMNGILLSLAIIFHISGMFLIATSGFAKGYFCHHYNWRTHNGPYSFNYSDPVFRSHHRHYDR